MMGSMIYSIYFGWAENLTGPTKALAYIPPAVFALFILFAPWIVT